MRLSLNVLITIVNNPMPARSSGRPHRHAFQERFAVKKPLISAMVAILAFSAVSVLGGCDCKTSLWQGLTNPSALVRSPEDTLTLPIMPKASAADMDEELPPNATGPVESDLAFTPTDYVIGPEDVLDISVLDLFTEGLETVLRRQVSLSGMVDMPLIQSIKAEGLTAEELRNKIAESYSPDILKNPTVSVTLVVQRQNTFSIGGAVVHPGTYNKTRQDMRLQEAIYLAGGQTMTNIPYVIVIRTGPSKKNPAPTAPATNKTEELPPLPEIPAEIPNAQPTPHPVEMQAAPGGGSTDIDRSELDRLLGQTTTRPTSQPASGPTTRTTKWIESANGPTTVPQEETAKGPRPTRVAPPVPTSRPSDELEWEKAIGMDNVRVIAIDMKKLMSGSDPQMNIIVRENDIINVPMLEQGEFYVMGEINRPGVYSLTGRKVTVKMALAAAGGVGPLAWPNNSILIRRIGPNQEQIIPIDIEAIMLGKQPDYFLKADDVVAIGTHILATPYAVIRNAFRLTYGFGFIYDRNFADPVPGETTLNSERFKRF